MPWQHDQTTRAEDARRYGAAYRRSRAIVMRRDKWRCQIRTPGICIIAASQCDHIIQPANGGTSAPENMRAACKPCHDARTIDQSHQARNGGGAPVMEDPRPRPSTAWLCITRS